MDAPPPEHTCICPARRPGQINGILGSMYSGKSSRLMEYHMRASLAGRRCVMLKYKHDNRYSTDPNVLVSHGRQSIDAIPIERLADALQYVQPGSYVFIDEGQFYPDLDEYCIRWAVMSCIVYVAALNGTSERKPWPAISKLISICTSIEFLSAVCRCGEDACYSHRFQTVTESVAGDGTVLIGGHESYEALCLSCYERKTGASRITE